MLTADIEVWRLLSEAITELREDCVDQMTRGACQCHAEYRERVGYLRGLDEVVAKAREIFGRMSGTQQEDPEE